MLVEIVKSPIAQIFAKLRLEIRAFVITNHLKLRMSIPSSQWWLVIPAFTILICHSKVSKYCNFIHHSDQWYFRFSITRKCFFWTKFFFSLSYCCIWKYVMIVHFHFISFLILDLPKLHTISFNSNSVLAGDDGDNRRTIINGHKSYDNTLIMKSKIGFAVDGMII